MITLVKFMKKITSSSLAVMMIFFFSIPQYSIASNNLPDTTNRQTRSHFSPENLDHMIIAQAQRRPGPRGKISGPRGGIRAGQQRGSALNRGSVMRNRRQGGRPFRGNRRQMGENGSPAPMDQGATGVSEIQSGQSMGQIESSSQRGLKFRKKMRKRMRRQRMQRREQQMGENGSQAPMDKGTAAVSEIQSGQSMGQVESGSQRGSKFRKKMRKRMRRQRMQRREQQMGENGSQAPMDKGTAAVSEIQSGQSMGQVEPGSRRSPKFRRKMRKKMRNKTGQRMRQQKTMRMQQRSKNAGDSRQKNRRTMRK